MKLFRNIKEKVDNNSNKEIFLFNQEILLKIATKKQQFYLLSIKGFYIIYINMLALNVDEC